MRNEQHSGEENIGMEYKMKMKGYGFSFLMKNRQFHICLMFKSRLFLTRFWFTVKFHRKFPYFPHFWEHPAPPPDVESTLATTEEPARTPQYHPGSTLSRRLCSCCCAPRCRSLFGQQNSYCRWGKALSSPPHTLLSMDRLSPLSRGQPV